MGSIKNGYGTSSIVSFGRYIVFFFVFFFFVKLNYFQFIVGNWSYFHDSLVPLAPTHLYYEKIFNENLPLWNPYLNAGTPLWPTVEAFASSDLIALLSWGVAVLFERNSLVAWQLTCFLWILIFSLGGAALSRRMIQNDWIQFSVFFILFGGPIAASMRAQAGGFLLPFRYLPWVLLFYSQFRENPNFRNEVTLCLILILNQAGFQNAYWMSFGLWYGLLFELDYRRYLLRNSLVNPFPWKKSLVILTCASSGYLASVIAGFEMMKLHALTREYHPQYFIFPWQRYLTSLIDLKASFHARHGSGFMSMAGLLLVCSGIILSFVKKIKANYSQLNNSGTTLWWGLYGFSLFFSLGGIAFWLDNQQTFLGLRNWGFILTLVILCQSQLFAIAAKIIFSRIPIFKKYLQACSFIVFILVSLELYFYSGNQIYFYPLFKKSAAQSVIPRISLNTREVFFEKRVWDLDLAKYVPYHLEVPGLWKIPSANLIPVLDFTGETPKYLNNLTHIFQTQNYQRLLIRQSSELTLKRDLGVYGEILSFNPNKFPTQFDFKVMEFKSGFLKVQTRSNTGGTLVYADSIDPYWRVSIDEKPGILSEVSGYAKAVAIPEGVHQVKFSYEPRLYIFAFFLRYFVIFVLALVLISQRVWSYRGFFIPRRLLPCEVIL